MQVYSEPGRLRKQCPDCKNYVHSRSGYCECGYEFTQGALDKAKEKEIGLPIYKEAGRGRKLCHGCKKYVGVRTLECKCGYDFSQTPPPPPLTKQQKEVVEIKDAFGVVGKTVVFTPAGSCPVKLKTFDEDSVFDWAESLMDFALGENRVFALSALKYYSREFVGGYNHKNYDVVAKLLNKWYDSYKNKEDIDESNAEDF